MSVGALIKARGLFSQKKEKRKKARGHLEVNGKS